MRKTSFARMQRIQPTAEEIAAGIAFRKAKAAAKAAQRNADGTLPRKPRLLTPERKDYATAYREEHREGARMKARKKYAERQADEKKAREAKREAVRRELEDARAKALEDRAARAAYVASEGYRQAVAAKHRARRDADRDRINARKTIWRKANLDWCAARSARRRSEKMQRTPKWLTAADHEKMLAVYTEAQAVEMDVDHVIPLKGTRVSGLHCPANLQIITRAADLGKLNHTWPGDNFHTIVTLPTSTETA